MASKVEIIEARPEHVAHVAADMRAADVDEIWSSGHLTPTEALELSLEYSLKCWTVLVDGAPAAMFGVSRSSCVNTGVPWLLATNRFRLAKKVFLKLSPGYISTMLGTTPRLFNFVKADNEQSIRWLKWCGFRFGEPFAHGPENEMFRMFWMEKSDV